MEDYGGYFAKDFYVEESTGDIVDDAIFYRNESVQERLNLTFEWQMITHGWNDRDVYLNAIRNSILSSSGEFDLLIAASLFMHGFVPEGILTELSGMPYIDVDMPWWSRDYIENAALDGKYYCITGDASLGYIKHMFCVFENLDLAETMNLAESPYELVHSGKWTLDKFTELIKDCYADLNGNTSVDDDDRFGLVISGGNPLFGFTEPTDFRVIEFDGDEPKLALGSERNTEIIQRLVDFVWTNEAVYFDSDANDELADEYLFRNNTVVFATGELMHTDSYRNLDFRYGVLPYPKLDESQEKYATTLLPSYCTFAIPIDCKDSARTSAVLEAMGSESYKTVTPAYFETALKVKYSQDNETSQMFDIIRDGAEFNFGNIYSNAMNLVGDQIKNAIGKNDTNWASRVAGIEANTQALLDTLVNSIREIG